MNESERKRQRGRGLKNPFLDRTKKKKKINMKRDKLFFISTPQRTFNKYDNI